MFDDFLTCLGYAVCFLVSIVIARGCVEMVREGKYSWWKSYAGSLALTGFAWCFVCERVLEIPFDDYFGKLLAVTVVQSLAFVYFRASSAPPASSSASRHG